MTTMSSTGGFEREERIRSRAYAIWEAAGRPDGEADLHWQKACSDMDGEEAADSAATTAPQTAAPTNRSADLAVPSAGKAKSSPKARVRTPVEASRRAAPDA